MSSCCVWHISYPHWIFGFSVDVDCRQCLILYIIKRLHLHFATLPHLCCIVYSLSLPPSLPPSLSFSPNLSLSSLPLLSSSLLMYLSPFSHLAALALNLSWSSLKRSSSPPFRSPLSFGQTHPHCERLHMHIHNHIDNDVNSMFIFVITLLSEIC